MTHAETAVKEINDILDISAGITHDDRTLKCWLPSEEGGVDKAYLEASHCERLAAAFGVLATKLAARSGGSAR